MGLRIPDLDDQEFEELFEEARRQIPVYSDEWSDHNTHDTGIAILELLAWITETHTYQINRLTDEHREKYLELLGVEREPPQPASAALSITTFPGTDGAVIPAGTQLTVDDQSDDKKSFQVTRDTRLVEANITEVVTMVEGDIVNNTKENETTGTQYYPFGKNPRAGDAVYFGFDRDPFAAADTLSLMIDFHDEHLPEPATHGGREPTFEPSVDLRWQYCTSYPNWESDSAWADLPVAEDETSSLYSGGIVTLEKPVGWNATDEPILETPVLDQPPGSIWIRCVVDTPGYENPPQVRSVRLNVLCVEHRRTVTDELLRRDDETLETTIEANQTFYFSHTPVLDAEIEIDGEQWTEVSNFDRSGPNDTHYVLDRSQGSVTFGNGMAGAKPPVRSHVVATRYESGGGERGNVSERSIWEFVDEEAELTDNISYEDLELTPINRGSGGVDMESISEALDRFKRDLKRPYRATTLEDIATVAKHTPGLRFGRTHAVTTSREVEDGTQITEITVVAVPYSRSSRPEPSEGFLDAVRTQINRTKLLSDPVSVRGPTYVDVGMDVTVSARTGYDRGTITTEIRERMVDYLHPITGYDGNGWPFGRSLYVADVTAILSSMAGVGEVVNVSLTAAGGAEVDDHGTVVIPETALLAPSLSDISVRVVDQLDLEREGRSR